MRYQLFCEQYRKQMWMGPGPIGKAGKVSDLSAKVNLVANQYGDWKVMDTLKNVEIPQETVLKLCGL